MIRYEESRWMGMQNNVIDEINIDAVHGVSTRMCRSISVIGLIASLVLLIVGLIALFGNPFGYASPIQHTVGIVALLIMAIIIISSLKPSFVFSVSGSIVQVKQIDNLSFFRYNIINNMNGGYL